MELDSPAAGIIFVLGIISILTYVKRNELITSFKAINWYLVIAIIIVFCLIILLSVYGFKRYARKQREKQQQEIRLTELDRELHRKLKQDLSKYSFDVAVQELNEIKQFVSQLPEELASKYNLQEYFSKWENQIAQIKEAEAIKEKERLEEQRRHDLARKEEQRKIVELFEFKKKHNSIQALPINADYSNEVIQKSEVLFKSYQEEQKKLARKKQEAVDYYSKNSLESKPKLSDEEELLYAQVREDIQDGRITLKKIPTFTGNVSFKSNFYRAKELDEEAKKRALEEGFIHIRGIELNGHLCGGGFYIRKESNESDYHFTMKHLFAELLKCSQIEYAMLKCSQIEYAINGKRVDVAIIKDNVKLGIEIETGNNNSEQLAAKIQWLNENFTHWIFVCSRKNFPKFNQMVDNQKSYCLTAKAAMEKVMQLFSIAVKA